MNRHFIGITLCMSLFQSLLQVMDRPACSVSNDSYSVHILANW